MQETIDLSLSIGGIILSVLLCSGLRSIVLARIRLGIRLWLKWAESSGVASYGALGHVPLLKFWKRISLTVKISKITKENH